jgi:hypothetical protein
MAVDERRKELEQLRRHLIASLKLVEKELGLPQTIPNRRR